MGLIKTIKTLNLLKKKIDDIDKFIAANKDKYDNLLDLYIECRDAIEYLEEHQAEIKTRIDDAKYIIKRIGELISK